jgi:hypothetical protein
MTDSEMTVTIQNGLGQGRDGRTIKAGDTIQHIKSRKKFIIIRGCDGWVLEHIRTLSKSPLETHELKSFIRIK